VTYILILSNLYQRFRGPLVVCSHLRGGLQAWPNIYLILRQKYVNGKFVSIHHFFSITRKQPDGSMKQMLSRCTIILYKFRV